MVHTQIQHSCFYLQLYTYGKYDCIDSLLPNQVEQYKHTLETLHFRFTAHTDTTEENIHNVCNS